MARRFKRGLRFDDPVFFHDGIHLDFGLGAGALGHYVKAAGAAPTQAALTTLFTFTGGNQSYYRAASGLLVAAETDTPRIEYDANGNCLGLLMEAARTNLCLQSQTFDNASWTKTRATVSADATTSPDGTANADALVEDATAANSHFVGQTISFTSGTAYTATVFVKAAARSFVAIQFGAAAFGVVQSVYLNLSSGAIGTTAGTPTVSVESFSNGWYRLRLTATATATAGANINIFAAEADNDALFDGLSQNSIYIYGAQVEAGAFPSSYIPTTTTSVARSADVCTRTLGSEFSATAGTVVVRGRASGGQDAANGNHIVGLDDGTANERIRFLRAVGTDTARVQVTDGGVGQALLDGTFTNSALFKAAYAWAANDFAFSFNGGAVVTDAAGTLPTMTTLWLGGAFTADAMNGHIRTFDYWPTRLPNTFLTSY